MFPKMCVSEMRRAKCISGNTLKERIINECVLKKLVARFD